MNRAHESNDEIHSRHEEFSLTHITLSLSNWVGFIHIYRKFTQLTKLIYSLIQIHFTLGYLVQPETGQVQGSRFALGSFTHTVRMHFSTFSWKVGKGELEICIESITIAHGKDHPSSPPRVEFVWINWTLLLLLFRSTKEKFSRAELGNLNSILITP